MQKRLLARRVVNLIGFFIDLSNNYYLESFISLLTLARLLSPKFWVPFITLEISWQKEQEKGNRLHSRPQASTLRLFTEKNNQPCRTLCAADTGNCNIPCTQKFVLTELRKSGAIP